MPAPISSAASANRRAFAVFKRRMSAHLSKMQRATGGSALLKKGEPLVARQDRFETSSVFDQWTIKQNADIGITEVTREGDQIAEHSGHPSHRKAWRHVTGCLLTHSCWVLPCPLVRYPARLGNSQRQFNHCLGNGKARPARHRATFDAVNGGLRCTCFAGDPGLGPTRIDQCEYGFLGCHGAHPIRKRIARAIRKRSISQAAPTGQFINE